MQKFGIILVKGNDVRVLETMEDKEAAYAAKKRWRELFENPFGMVSMVKADFDENDRMTSRNCLIY